MKIKTSELTGAALDWAVEQIESGAGPDKAQKQWRYFGRVFHPSTDREQGWQIIERELITVCALSKNKFSAGYAVANSAKNNQTGPTFLIAGMRCYVASKMGDEIEIPEELT